MSRVTELLGSKYPIIQGAMGVISNPEMVAAVSNAGGYGLLATAFASDLEVVRGQIRATRELTDKPFGINLQIMNPISMQIAEMLAEEGIVTATVSGGSPKAMIPFLRERGIKAISVVPTVEVAKKAEMLGADAVIAEGSESGGIQGVRSATTMVLVPMVADAVKIPVIAAGGIADSRGYRAALELGAEGVQVGTRFIASLECSAHENYKKLIVESAETGTGLIGRGRIRVRALLTPLVEKIIAGEIEDTSGFAEGHLEESWVEGNIDAGSLPAGEIAGMIQKIIPVREIIEEMTG